MEMTYKHMVEQARQTGTTNEKTMWESIESFSELLEELKEAHPELYWEFMRSQHGIMYHGHYDESFAMYDVAQMHYTGKTGEKHSGPHWTAEQIEQATAGMKFPAGTTRWDKYVAFNAMWADLSKGFDDGEVLKAAFLFYFADEDWPGDSKVWDYMGEARKHSEK